MAAVPEHGTPEYRLWEQGALAEAQARDAGIAPELREVRDVLESHARCFPDQSASELAGTLAYIFTADQPLRRRLRIAFHIVRWWY